MAQRRLYFPGNDQDYIWYLENLVLGAAWSGVEEFPPMLRQEITYEQPPCDSLKIIQYSAQTPSAVSERPGQAEPRWKKELNTFISDLQQVGKQWEWARCQAGIATTCKNRLALRLMLGHTNAAACRPIQDKDIPPIIRSEHQDLVLRGYQYAHFLRDNAENLSFTASVVSFQALIFVSYCVVMIHCGVSEKATNQMMRHYILSENDDETLRRYRRGVVWINRCMAALLANGWGHRSWEIFLLETRSMAQLARFAANKKESYEEVAQKLGKVEEPLVERDRIPYCIPCLVQSLAGENVGLGQICDSLGYGSLDKSPVNTISAQFVHSVQGLVTNSDSTP